MRVGGRGSAYFPATTQFIRGLFGPRGEFAYLADFAAPLHLMAHDIAAPATLRPAQPIKGLTVRTVLGHHGDAPAVIYRIAYAGKSITFSGDIDVKGLPALQSLAQGSDLLVFNAVVLDPPDSPAVLYDLHTPPHAIGALATAAGVHQVPSQPPLAGDRP